MHHAVHGRVRCAAVGAALAATLVAGCSGGGGSGSPTRSSGDVAVTLTATRVADTPTAAPAVTVTPSFTARLPPNTPTPSPDPTTAVPATSTPAPSATASIVPTNTPETTPSTTPTQPPTAIPTFTPLTGPIVTAFGLASADGKFIPSSGTDKEGRQIFHADHGDGFIVFVEARPGPSQLPVGRERLRSSSDPMNQPDLQIESTQSLGNGSARVCDNSFPTLGGVPAINALDFSPVQSVSDALNDFSCRFKTFTETDFACTQDGSGNFIFGDPSSTIQFCVLVDDAMVFPAETVLSVRVRDTAGHAGPPVQIVVRVDQPS